MSDGLDEAREAWIIEEVRQGDLGDRFDNYLGDMAAARMGFDAGWAIAMRRRDVEREIENDELRYQARIRD